MKVECTDKKTFKLTRNGQPLGSLTYKSLFSFSAEICFAQNDCYKIKPVGFFGTSISVTKGKQEIANLKMNWKGQIIISFKEGEEFAFKAKGAFLDKYYVENRKKEIVLQFHPRFNWAKFDYNYDISFNKEPVDILLALLGIYASNYFIAVMTGAMA